MCAPAIQAETMLRERLNDELKKSMLAKNQQATATLRLIMAALKDRDIAARSKGHMDGIGEDEILSMLPQVLPMEQMSFLELRYSLPGRARRNPGIRFWLEGPLREKRLRAILFEDTVVWHVSHDLEKLYTELGTFLLQGDRVVGSPAASLPDKPAADSDWRVLLRAVVHAPLSRPGPTEEAVNSH